MSRTTSTVTDTVEGVFDPTLYISSDNVIERSLSFLATFLAPATMVPTRIDEVENGAISVYPWGTVVVGKVAHVDCANSGAQPSNAMIAARHH